MTDLYFQPWLRTGLAGAISGPTSSEVMARRAGVEAYIDINGERHTRWVTIAGPGDVASLDAALFGRRHPEDGTTDAEPNYFASVEILAGDVPWRYTPAGPDGDNRLRPWLVLVVVEAGDGVSIVHPAGAPNPELHIAAPADAAAELPDLSDSASWVHVQSTVPAAQVAAHAHDPDVVRSRLLCPRRLDADTSYIAAVVPAFAAGVVAARGLEPDTSAVTTDAWDRADLDAGIVLPTFCWWSFGTGPAGDFEALASRLHPAPLGPRVGLHAMDISSMSPSLPGAGSASVDYRGVLRSPVADAASWERDHRSIVRPALRDLVDAGANPPTVPASAGASYDPDRDDPRIGPPLYGARTAALSEIPADDDDGVWATRANLNPALRAAAGVGADLVRRDQEAYVAAAWRQVGDVADAQALAFRAGLAAATGGRMAERAGVIPDEALIQVTAPQHRAMAADGYRDMAERVAQSDVPAGVTDPSLARLARSSSVVGRTYAAAVEGADRSSAIVAGASVGQVLTRTHLQASSGRADLAVLRNYSRFDAPSGMTSDPLILRSGTEEAPGVVLGGAFESQISRFDPGTIVGRDGVLVDLSEHLTIRFVGSQAGHRRRDATHGIDAGTRPGGSPGPWLPELPVGALPADAVIAAEIRQVLDPVPAVIEHLFARVPALRDLVVRAGAAGGAPTMPGLTLSFDDPLIVDLIARSAELFVPGAEDLALDGVGLAEVDNGVISSLLLGANEALVRELVWRGLPIAVPQTPLRHFWEPGTIDDVDAASTWAGRLSDQVVGPTAGAEGEAPDFAVVVARASLFRRYPGTRIMLVGAMWDGDVTVADHSRQSDPVILGNLDPRTRFAGFGYSVDTLRGDRGSGARTRASAGWFVAFEEEPTEARFGLDAPRRDATDLAEGAPSWSDLTWGHLDDGNGIPTHASGAMLPDRTDRTLDGVTWGRNAAHQAHICYQPPFRALIHADDLLGEP